MKAILCTQFGGPDDLVMADLPDPVAGPGEIVVRIAAVGLNFFDTLIISGKYQIKPPFPFSPGSEFSGIVEHTGAGVSDPVPGDRVAGYSGYGAARERIAIPAGKVVKIPARLDDERAAGVIVTYGTTHHALRDRAALKPGETLAVLGAAGGTGLAAVELGKRLGARVIACASSPQKLAFARAHGADETIDYSATSLKDELRRVTEGRGADVIYDPVGGDYAEQALRAIAWGGRFLVIGFAAGEIPKIPLNLVLLKSCDIRGVTWGAFAGRELEKHRAAMAELIEWCADGALSAKVHAVYPLADIARALKDIAARAVMGKLILRP